MVGTWTGRSVHPGRVSAGTEWLVHPGRVSAASPASFGRSVGRLQEQEDKTLRRTQTPSSSHPADSHPYKPISREGVGHPQSINTLKSKINYIQIAILNIIIDIIIITRK